MPHFIRLSSLLPAGFSCWVRMPPHATYSRGGGGASQYIDPLPASGAPRPLQIQLNTMLVRLKEAQASRFAQVGRTNGVVVFPNSG